MYSVNYTRRSSHRGLLSVAEYVEFEYIKRKGKIGADLREARWEVVNMRG
jgi:hypothetical protein